MAQIQTVAPKTNPVEEEIQNEFQIQVNGVMPIWGGLTQMTFHELPLVELLKLSSHKGIRSITQSQQLHEEKSLKTAVVNIFE